MVNDHNHILNTIHGIPGQIISLEILNKSYNRRQNNINAPNKKNTINYKKNIQKLKNKRKTSNFKPIKLW